MSGRLTSTCPAIASTSLPSTRICTRCTAGRFVVTALTSVLPLVGSAAVWVPGTIYLLAIGKWPAAIVLGAWLLLAARNRDDARNNSLSNSSNSASPDQNTVGERRAVSGLKELAAGSRFRKQLIIHSGSESAGVRDFIHL